MVSHLRAGTLLCEALAAAGLLECDWAVAVDLKNGDPQFPGSVSNLRQSARGDRPTIHHSILKPMSTFTLYAKNLRALRSLEWSPRGVSLLVGANGAGKSTVLQALKFLRLAVHRDPAEAVNLAFGGYFDLKNRVAAEHEPIEIGIRIGNLDLCLRLVSVQGLTISAEATLHDGVTELFRGDTGGSHLSFLSPLDPVVPDFISTIIKMGIFHDPDICSLRGGSNIAHTQVLDSRGTNAITMLRGWFQRRPDRWRYDFVLTGLRAAFPRLIADLDFVEAGNTIAAQIYRPGSEMPAHLGSEANGVLALLVLLCDLAATEQGGIVAIDEPENSLHPYAIRLFVRLADQLARRNDLTVVFTTHSPVLLDAFNDKPEQVYVLDGMTEPAPVRLSELKNPEWLRQFRLGELYADDGIVSNDDESGCG
ncbi:AAA family ATPase [uncultured Lamprocystis sp.]|jgi:predicted ATPase|uniref:AAA family ATPase n=1 Tax=uncultured Lamprocystis sp. TaxID=543132 RepID=UPI0025F69CE6|nr:ATP-binding protein [uncultured Lamprocystis sp.]